MRGKGQEKGQGVRSRGVAFVFFYLYLTTMRVRRILSSLCYSPRADKHGPDLPTTPFIRDWCLCLTQNHPSRMCRVVLFLFRVMRNVGGSHVE